jgi:RNA polymerase sigma-70 factor (ECF subfamily)
MIPVDGEAALGNNRLPRTTRTARTSDMTTPDTRSVDPDASTNFSAEVHAYRPDLLRIAKLQLRDEDAAADVVQETVLAAFQSRQTFTGKSKLKTWLIGILKFKIIDALRARGRQPVPASRLKAELDVEDIDALFDSEGIWRNKPSTWEDPESEARQQDFMKVMELCLEKLPPNSARVFMLRELFELDADEICTLTSFSRNHLGVLLYRARMSLRGCLEVNWLGHA